MDGFQCFPVEYSGPRWYIPLLGRGFGMVRGIKSLPTPFTRPGCRPLDGDSSHVPSGPVSWWCPRSGNVGSLILGPSQEPLMAGPLVDRRPAIADQIQAVLDENTDLPWCVHRLYEEIVARAGFEDRGGG